jgi:hypothetical protein
MSDTDAFSPLDTHCYLREARTEDGRQGFALIDSDGEIELFSEDRSEVFFYVMKHGLVFVNLN